MNNPINESTIERCLSMIDYLFPECMVAIHAKRSPGHAEVYAQMLAKYAFRAMPELRD